MNKLPTKQIYLLTVIIVGIIALSVYSTYALFTFESSTSDIVSIHTPKSLKISENIYEYQQLTIEPNTVTTTDIDIYNTFDYEVCYSIWYKILGDIEIENKVQIFQKSDQALTSSGVLPQLENIRVTIVIINDNDSQIKINIGTIGEQIETGSCSLNLSSDKKVISATYQDIENLNTKLLKEINEIKTEESNYLTYKNETKVITYKNTDSIYISDKFTYNDELFTLEESENITIQELVDKKYLENQDVYFCKEEDRCTILYKLNNIVKQDTTEELINEITGEPEIYYDIKSYDKLIGYLGGDNGLKKINQQDYVFYGDNPNNYLYYNCQNDNDTSTCELWRIVGLYYNQETNKYNMKIVRNESIGTYALDNTENESLNWTNSTLHKYLNEEYKFLNNYEIYLEEYKQNSEIITSIDTEIQTTEEIINSKINLLSISDYLNTSSCNITKINEATEICLKNNWLNNIELNQTWTMTKKEIIKETIEENIEPEIEESAPTTENSENDEVLIEEEQEIVVEKEEIINYAYSIGNNIIERDTKELLEVRPVIFLKSRMLLVSGDGSFESPYIIK